MKIVLNNARSQALAFKGYIVPVLSGVLIAFGAAYPILTLACFVMNIVYVFSTSAKETYRLLFILLPFAQVYKVTAMSGTSLYTVLELFAVVFLFLKRKKVDRSFLMLLLVWAVYVLVGSRLNILMWIKQLLIPLLIFLFFRYDQLDFKELVISLSVGLILSSIFAEFKEAIPNLAEMVRTTRLWEAEGVVYRFSGLYPDPNYYTALIILCSVSLLSMYACRTMGWEALALFVTLTIWGAETGSKSYLLMLCAILALFVICLFVTKRYIMGMLSLVVIMIFSIAVFFGGVEIFENIVIRLQAGDLTTGRLDNWVDYINYLSNDWPRWIFGSGIGAGYLNNLAAHNTYVDFAYYYGLLGTVIWFVLSSKAVGKIQIPNLYISSLPLLCMAVMSLFLSYVIFFDFAFAAILVVYALKTDFQKIALSRRDSATKKNDIESVTL